MYKVMNFTLDSETQALLAPLKLSLGTEALLKAIQSLPTILHYAPYWGDIRCIEIAAVPNTDRPIVRVKAVGKNSATIELYCCMRTVHGKLNLIEYDLPNVQRCSTDPEVRRKAGHPC